MVVDTHKDSELLAKVEEALKTIRPYLEADGGDVKIVGITEEKVVLLELVGTCESCPMSAMTLKAGVEQSIISVVPEINGIKAINV